MRNGSGPALPASFICCFGDVPLNSMGVLPSYIGRRHLGFLDVGVKHTSTAAAVRPSSYPHYVGHTRKVSEYVQMS